MKVRHALMVAALVLAGLPAQAQVIVSLNSTAAHTCFVMAKLGTSPRDGVEACNQALTRDALSIRDQAATYDNRGVILDLLGRHDDAAADFRHSIALDSSLGDPEINLGSSLIRQRQYEDALVHINKGLDMGMSFPHIGYYDRAIAFEMLGRYKEAYYDYKKALELEPNFAQASERLKDFTVIRKPADPS